jgi:hypothetical protein
MLAAATLPEGDAIVNATMGSAFTARVEEQQNYLVLRHEEPILPLFNCRRYRSRAR